MFSRNTYVHGGAAVTMYLGILLDWGLAQLK